MLAPWYAELERIERATRTDARAEDPFIAHMRRLLGKISETAPPDVAEEVAREVGRSNAREFKRVFGFSRDGDTSRLARDFAQRNAALITGANAQTIADIRNVVDHAHAKGSRVEVVKKRVQERFAVSESRASLIARDQVLKLNANITKQRMQDAGVARYKWSTSRDERVRGKPGGEYEDTPGDHWRLEGKIFSWTEPPVVDTETGRTAHPGEDYQCRCIAVPVFDDVDEPTETFAPSPSFGAEFEPALVRPSPSASERIVENIGGLANARYLREGMRDLTQARAPYIGKTREQAAAFAARKLDPVKVTIEISESGATSVELKDGRHRLAAAREAGAPSIRAEVRTFVQRRGKWRELPRKVTDLPI